MNTMRTLFNRIRGAGILFVIGVIMIVYVAIGLVYLQQAAQQREFKQRIAKLGAVVARPLPSAAKLQEEYDEVLRALAPMTDRAAIAMLVGIAERSGIDVSPESGKFLVPPAGFGWTRKGSGAYQVVSFRSIHVQGEYEKVMAFIEDLDSGKTLNSMVLKRLDISEQAVRISAEEQARRDEFRSVMAAVAKMMADNGVVSIPNALRFAGGRATNLMGDDPNTAVVIEGFPDSTTPVAQKGYTGTGTPRDGYVLYRHAKIPSVNTTDYQTVSYLNTLTTKYFYTCESDGTVRQFKQAAASTATEYEMGGEFTTEMVVSLDVEIYTRPRG